MALTKVIGDGLGSTNDLNVETAIPNIDIKDTGTAQSSMDFLSNSDTVRATIGMERSAGGGLFVGSSAYAAVFGTASSGNTEFATNNNIQMKIDSAGHVTMPNQSAFNAILSGHITISTLNAYNTLVFGTERFDQNGDYNTSDGTFTAPVTGRYLLTTSLYLFNSLDSAAQYYYLNLETSNETVDVYFETSNFLNADTNGYNMQASVITDLSASDTAKVKMYQAGGSAQTQIAGGHSHFSGALIC